MHNNDHNISKEKKRLTNYRPKIEKSKVERLVFYVLGKSKRALLPGQIEKEVQKHDSNQRPNYVYEVLKKRAPDSSELTHTLLFRYNQFFDENEKKIELRDEKKNNLKNKICSKIFDSYRICSWVERQIRVGIPSQKKN